MAVDSRNKRASCIGFGLATLVLLPAPDGAISQADRQQVTAAYAGILADAPTAEIARTRLTAVYRPSHRLTATLEI